MKFRIYLACLVFILIPAFAHAQHATIDGATLHPGDTVMVSINATSGVQNLKALDLTLKPLPFTPTWATGTLTQGWTVLTDPDNPWHIGLLSFNAANGPGELLKLTLQTSASTQPGSYALAAQSFKTVQNGQDVDITSQTAPGSIVVPGLKGDVTEDGNITLADVVASLQIFIGGEAKNSQTWAGDLNCKDGVDSIDVNRLFRKAILNEEWPNCDGSYFIHELFPHGIAVSPDELSYFYSEGDKLKQRDINGTLLSSKSLGTGQEITDIFFTADHSYLVVMDRIHIFLLRASDLSIFRDYRSQYERYAAAMTPDNQILVVVSSGGAIQFYDVTSGSQVPFFTLSNGTQFNGFAFAMSEDGSKIAVTESWPYPNVYIYPVVRETPIGNYLPLMWFATEKTEGRPSYMRFSPDGNLLATTYIGGHIQVDNLSNGTVLRHFDTDFYTIPALSFIKGETELLIGGPVAGSGEVGGSIQRWSLKDGAFSANLLIPGTLLSMDLLSDELHLVYSASSVTEKSGIGYVPIP